MPLFKSVDLTSPGPIGSTTPNTGKFTTLTLAPSANTTPFTASGYSLTGTNAQSLFDLSGTWNTSGTPTAFKLNVTDTASNASSLLMDLQVGGTSQFSVAKTGTAWVTSNSGIFQIGTNSQVAMQRSGGALNLLAAGTAYFQINAPNIVISQSSLFGWNSTGLGSGTFDLQLARDASDILAQRRTTNAQTFRIYNTYTDASNYERGFMRWATNVLEIGAEAAGTGTQRQLRFPLGTVTVSTPLSITQTWNSAGVTFTGIQANITDTASASASLLMDLQVGGSSIASIRKNGSIRVPVITGANTSIGVSDAMGIRFESDRVAVNTSADVVLFRSSEIRVTAGIPINWNQDVYLHRDAAAILAQRNSTNAQAFKLYRTFTDASNYERLGFLATNTTRYTITSENAGTGSARSLEVSFYTAASDPTSTDITSGCFSVWKNSGTGIVKLWVNDGGTMKSVALV